MDGIIRLTFAVCCLFAGGCLAQPFESADDLLGALEEADQDLSALSADILYVKTFFLSGDEQTRTGDLAFVASKNEAQTSRRFAIDFNQLKMGSRIEEDYLYRYVFDGEWLLELDLQHKQFTRRQIVPPGESFDPLRIGEGPFPIPIGQRRDEILRRFDAELVSADDGLDDDKLVQISKAWSQIKLTPKEAWEDEIDFAEVRLWYQARDDGRILPRMARTRNEAGDESTVLLMNVKVNDESTIDDNKLRTDPPREGWDGQIIPWRGPGNG